MLKKKVHTVCIFCGSKSGKLKIYNESAKLLGQKLSIKNIKVIYGGGESGIMGALAKGVHQNKGILISVVPEIFKKNNFYKRQNEKIIYKKSLSERKKYMIKYADVFLVLPGGFGTFDEIFEVLSLNQLNIINKKIVLLNVNNFFNNFRSFINDLKKQGFLYTNKNIYFKRSVNDVINFIENKSNI